MGIPLENVPFCQNVYKADIYTRAQWLSDSEHESLVQDSSEALCCVLKQDTLSSD